MPRPKRITRPWKPYAATSRTADNQPPLNERELPAARGFGRGRKAYRSNSQSDECSTKSCHKTHVLVPIEPNGTVSPCLWR